MRYLTVGEDGRNVFAPWLVPFHASCSSFCICIRSGDASIKTFNIEDKVFVANLEGHDDSVQAGLHGCAVAHGLGRWGSVCRNVSLKDVVFEPISNKFLISASSDATFSLWQ